MTDRIEAEELRQVVERARAGDPDAWELLYVHCRTSLYGYARRRLPSDVAAEDAVSEAFMRAIRRLPDFAWRGGGFDAWMYGITRNVVLEQHRRSGRDRALAVKEARATIGVEGAAPGLVGDDLEAAEERARVRLAFSRLSDTDREVLELRVMGGLTSEEVAAVIESSPGAVRMAQSRALDRLRNILKELEDA